MAEGIGHFVELIIAATIGSMVGAFIMHEGIQLSFGLFMRALFATTVLAIFFFFLWQFSKGLGQRGPKSHRALRREQTREPRKFSYDESAPEEFEELESEEGQEAEDEYAEDYAQEEAEYEQEAEYESAELEEFKKKMSKHNK